ncbi:glycosyltransferase family 39 protein [Cytophagaceae bacterium DM2B3-1]|uniref:Glycosyltransferase family 39 protein n=1 Tax=Xanthocytophaga flava TaxID=3048013 RepID=A0ABT7CHZ2_9BACT|nr:glycosyltransferase family 39 protein [Xanthocytophaga flavus]MDJ1493364.1 glycosyltransferase family 39 protein [Xanthocytophaga flavus]
MNINQDHISRVFKISCLGFIVYGIFIRLFHFVSNRSLYTDEGYLGYNLLARNFRDLAEPLDANQHAPLFFLWIEKLNMSLFGTSEYALRLFPLIIGILSIFLFYYLCKQLEFNQVATLAGMIVFTTAFPLVYYSSETKQYIVELAATLCSYLLYYHFNSEKRFSALSLYALSGALLVWFSYPVIFILVSISFVHLLMLALQKKWSPFFVMAIVYAIWGISFLVNFAVIILPNSLKTNTIVDMWTTEFAPLPPYSINDIKWYGIMIFKLFHEPLNLNWTFLESWFPYPLLFSFLGLLFMVWGTCHYFKKEKEKLGLFILPVLIALIASGVHRYPFTERFLVFLVPNFLILVCCGVEQFYNKFSSYSRPIVLIVIVWLVIPPVFTSVKDIIQEEQFGGWKRREIKKGIRYLSEHKKNDEFIFINGVAYSFQYYNKVYHLNWPYAMLWNGDELNNQVGQKAVLDDIYTKSSGKKFWVIVAGDLSEDVGANHKDQFLHFFKENFNQLQYYKAKGIYVGQFSHK